MSTTTKNKVVKVKVIPWCDICGQALGEYDAPTKNGAWANMCEECWEKYGRYPGKLGTGYGQRWVTDGH